MLVTTTLPDDDRVGDLDAWSLPAGGMDGHTLEFTGYFLGAASSRKPLHRGHYGREFAASGERCGACRWFEPRVFREVKAEREDVVLGTVSDLPGVRDLVDGDTTDNNQRVILKHYSPRTGRYLVYRTGRSIVPGEVDFTSYEWVDTAVQLIDALTTRPSEDRPFLSNPAADVLEVAAQYDLELRDAYRRLVEN